MITIIVLLILAGISISMLAGDNSILSRAGQARDDTIVGQEKEQVELAYVTAAVKNLGANVTGQNLQDELDISVGSGKTTVTGSDTLKVIFNETKHCYKVNNGNVSEEEPYILGKKVEDDSMEYIDSSGKAVIPKGFAIVKDCGLINEGLVISDVENDDLSNSKHGNQFVWIPVNNLTEIKVIEGDGVDANGRKNYISSTELNCGYIEPANLSEDNTSKLSEWTSTLYQEKFNEMVESVIKYGGFYIGRYELSVNSEGIAQCKKGESAATATSESLINWYGLYTASESLSSEFVKTEMVWYGQWEAMLECIENNGETIYDRRPNQINSTIIAGNTEIDKLYNIYDLYGSCMEWIQAAGQVAKRPERI